MVGDIQRHGSLRMSYYSQHSEDQLDLELSPIAFLQKTFPKGLNSAGGFKKMELTAWRCVLGCYGIRCADLTTSIAASLHLYISNFGPK